jgi:hypothetical protein
MKNDGKIHRSNFHQQACSEKAACGRTTWVLAGYQHVLNTTFDKGVNYNISCTVHAQETLTAFENVCFICTQHAETKLWHSYLHCFRYFNIYINNLRNIYPFLFIISDRLCGLAVRVPGYRSRGHGFDSRCYKIFWEVVGLERGPLSLVRIT